ncbi:hypothetical protein EUZ85_20785 [Hahella sp. KA22]|uniref:peptidoglycan binding protein CsiV n=2 Tax=Hahella sp. KA22 TaxID=1628392 RepID=UPI000FDE9DB9|nr:peptidoglycan binding protein CsiV [Hahella sp. KA22]AZZ93035.1 hypothetical protein ENC22_18200 [Hahella sp. KA22]QAY56409.1 hypothetical protein EUZ85_20785 [Hahella sp. KA22]
MLFCRTHQLCPFSARSIAFFLTLFLGLMSSSLRAYAGLYQIDLIMFKTPVPEGEENFEYYPVDYNPEAPLLVDFTPLSSLQKQALGANQVLLKWIANNLERRSGYQVVWHKSWVSNLAYNQDTPVRIFDTERLGEGYSIEGVVSLSRTRYLHTTIDLSLVEWRQKQPGGAMDNMFTPFPEQTGAANALTPMPQNAPEAKVTAPDSEEPFMEEAFRGLEPVARYRNRQSRRMRSGQVHYLDHPVVGVLVKIIPVRNVRIQTSVDTAEGDLAGEDEKEPEEGEADSPTED